MSMCENVKKNEDGSWTSVLLDAGDGSGDAIVPLPDGLLDELGWDEDTEIVIEAAENRITLRRA